MSFGDCTGHDHCGNAHTCGRCARERQRRIADKAEALERDHGQLTLTVLRPALNTQDEIRRLRGSFLRRALAPAGIWTVETGSQFAGLHLNIISPLPAPAKWRNCETYSELIQTTARDAAAYISKRSGMPPREQYEGRLYGCFGQISNIIVSQRVAPIVAAAAVEMALSGGSLHESPPPPDLSKDNPTNNPDGWVCDEAHYDRARPYAYYPNAPEKSNPPYKRKERSLEEYRAIMRRHLPNLLKFTERMEVTSERAHIGRDAAKVWEEGRE